MIHINVPLLPLMQFKEFNGISAKYFNE